MPEPFVEESVFFSSVQFLLFFVQNQVFIAVWINVRDLIPLIHVSVFMPIPSCFCYYSPILELEVRNADASRGFVIVQGCFSYPGYSFFHMKLSTETADLS